MTAAKRALLYLTRKKGRSILLILIIFIMSSFIMVGAVLKVSVDKEAEKIRKNLGNAFLIEIPLDDEIYNQPSDDGAKRYIGPNVTLDMIDKIINLDGVVDYCPRFGNIFAETSLILRPGLWASSMEAEDTRYSEEEYEYFMKQAYLSVCKDGELYKSFRTGALNIVQGRNIQRDDHHKIVISEYLAERNQVSVGDTCNVAASDLTFIGETVGTPIELEIVGIFRTNLQQEPSKFTDEIQYSDNFMFVDLDTGTELYTLQTQKQHMDFGVKPPENIELFFNDVTFFVSDPEKLTSIMQVVSEEIGLEKGLILTKDDTSYQASIRPLKQISVLALVMLGAGIIGCMVILSLLLTMWIKSRKREIAILISIGISKGKIMMQMAMECILLSAIGLLWTILLSNTTITACCKAVEYMTASAQKQQEYSMKFDIAMQPVINKVSADAVQLEYDYSARDAILLIITVCGISSGSVLAASRQIMKTEPQSLFQTL